MAKQNEMNAEFKKIFKAMDADKSGTVSLDELKSYMAKVGRAPGKAEAVMKKFDTDNDKHLDEQEFIKMMNREARFSDTWEKIRADFKSLDKDGNGFVTADEYKSILKSRGAQAEKQARDWLSKRDVDGDGRISYTEFLSEIVLGFEDL